MNHFPPGPQGPGGCEFMPERLEILKICEADCIFRKSMIECQISTEIVLISDDFDSDYTERIFFDAIQLKI